MSLPLRTDLRQWADRIVAGLATVLVLVFVLMMSLVLLQVIDRFAPQFSFFWTEEIVRILLVWSVMLGLPVVMYQHQEISVDLFTALPPAVQRVRVHLVTVLSVVFLGFLCWQGYLYTLRSANVVLPTLGISRLWLYAPLPIGSLLAMFALVLRDVANDPMLTAGSVVKAASTKGESA